MIAAYQAAFSIERIGVRQRKDQLGEGRQAITEGSEDFALAEPVAERAGKTLVIEAVASAMPSMTPTVRAEVPSTVTM